MDKVVQRLKDKHESDQAKTKGRTRLIVVINKKQRQTVNKTALKQTDQVEVTKVTKQNPKDGLRHRYE